MEQLFLTILNRAVTAGWLVLLVMVLRVVLKKAPRAAHYGLWAIVAVRLLWPGELLPRALVYSGSAAVVYLAAYPILNAVFGTDLLMLGIYLPMLVVEPLLTYRFGRVQETMRKAVSKGLRITVGYALILFIVGCLREWLALGSVFGIQLSRSVLPMASMPAGGFIVLGVVCAVWRALARKHKEYLKTEARGTLAAHPRKEVQDQ